MKVMSVFGTRPEAIKMCPLVLELERTAGIESVVCLSGQHREMLQQVIDVFGIRVAHNLDIMQEGQTLSSITTNILTKIETVLRYEKPDILLVHGDTTTSFAAALAAFYQQIPVGHVEAGLRTGNKYSPYPEEMNRALTGRIAELHFAPTLKNRDNLYAENIRDGVFITGNTVIDAFKTTVKKDYVYKDPALAAIPFEGMRTVLVTAHRRENLGRPMESIFSAIRRLHNQYTDMVFVYPVHLNPKVQEPARRILGDCERVHLIPPIDVTDMHNLLARSFLVMTDSGGLQEEAPACGVPVVVLRTETERPEAVEAGTVLVAGVEEAEIIRQVERLANDKEAYTRMARAVNPYGDGHASERIVAHLQHWERGEHPVL